MGNKKEAIVEWLTMVRILNMAAAAAQTVYPIKISSANRDGFANDFGD